jgi:hypothetical protein
MKVSAEAASSVNKSMDDSIKSPTIFVQEIQDAGRYALQ